MKPDRLPSSTWMLASGVLLSVVGLLQTPGGTQGGTQGTTSFPNMPAIATADSNGAMIAVTGMDVTGSSILYLIDTERRQLAVYQATGGSSTAKLLLVGARNIDLDLRLDGYNDKSEYSYKDLEKKFQGEGIEVR